MKLIFMLEERSMKELLDRILPKIMPENVGFRTIPHAGKRDLELSLPRKLRAWNEPDAVFVVVHDLPRHRLRDIARQTIDDTLLAYGANVAPRHNREGKAENCLCQFTHCFVLLTQKECVHPVLHDSNSLLLSPFSFLTPPRDNSKINLNFNIVLLAVPFIEVCFLGFVGWQ